ncbi:MAG TPA: translation initiation factor IF-2 N-terminal domain-containing protein, partial [Candidatus Xenobia bacterium]
MAKLRVYELAKELGVNTKDLMNILKDLGADVKTNFSTLEESAIAKAKEILKNKGGKGQEGGHREQAPSRPVIGLPSRPASGPGPDRPLQGRLIRRAEQPPAPSVAAPPPPP